ncbi:SIR2-domain-containing protein [Neolentinus lepideus HHB14362 ss-1]|uniref:SIR2-domain-containing protein n=1 Tax=Neolentinus lepideus HHB14362 ss-1 TaxID=1314782 RepID=A0A165PLE3_9AGAM|nr:SIR2-domain-containing protein [Neolentinus lepideus HHB14362 ss-1]
MDSGSSIKAETVVQTQNIEEKPQTQRISDICIYQAQGFLEAAEDIGIDPETVEDILNGFPTGRDDTSDSGDGDENMSNLQQDEENDLELAELAHFAEEAEEAWPKQEIRQLKRYLKEHGMSAFIRKYVIERDAFIPNLIYAFGISLCKELRSKRPTTLLYFLKVVLSQELRKRERLTQYSTVDDAVELIQRSRSIIILTGAGISVSCGIPDFRSRNGLYAQLKEKNEYELDDPQQMFDIEYFRENPTVFYSFASQIYPSNFTPSPCHRFIKLIEDKGKLLRNYTQNIDTLETLAGVQNVLQCHGSFATASCLNCRVKVPGVEIEQDILQRRVPLCKICNAELSNSRKPSSKKKGKKKGKKLGSTWDSDESNDPEERDYPPGIMKPDITFFGEKLNDAFDHALMEDRDKVDLLVIMGTSLQVAPVSETITYLPHSVPQILINKTPIKHINPDIVLLGNADDIVHHLCAKSGWELPAPRQLEPLRLNLRKRPSAEVGPTPQEPKRVGERCVSMSRDEFQYVLSALRSHVWLFDGAEGGQWVEDLEGRLAESPRSDMSCALSPASDDSSREAKKPRLG